MWQTCIIRKVQVPTLGYKSVSFWGNVKKDGVIPDDNSTYDALNYISSGLISYDKYAGFQGAAGPVVNRHVWPIHTTTINDSNGHLKNSYGFN